MRNVQELTLTDLPLENLLRHLAGRRATGTLTAVTARFRKKLFLIDGTLAGVASDNPREMLGHFLVGWGYITETQLSEAMQLHERIGSPLGRVLESIGAIDSVRLESALRAQAEEALYGLFLAHIESQRILENVLPSLRPLTLRLELVPLVDEGLRRRARLREILDEVGDWRAVPGPGPGPVPTDLSQREARIVAEIDGARDIDSLALACHLVPFVVAELVARGVREGFVTVRGNHTPQAPTGDLAPVAVAALDAGDLRRAWDAIGLLKASAWAADHGADIARLERRMAESLASRRISPELIPFLRSVKLPGLLLPGEAFVLSRVNDRWSLKEIGRVAPFPEFEFAVIVDSLLRQGLIELRPPTSVRPSR
ncbi:MAG: DUF4388 domain-containing protein [Acidobacteriota bacterium]